MEIFGVDKCGRETVKNTMAPAKVAAVARSFGLWGECFCGQKAIAGRPSPTPHNRHRPRRSGHPIEIVRRPLEEK